MQIPEVPAAEHVLTEEQEAVVMAAPSARQIVQAGAGTGKTHVLVRRVEHLMEEEGLAGGDEIILLTFSRAVVYELRLRTSSSGGDSRFATISTFDSFATRILKDALPEERYLDLGYDDRIRLATASLADSSIECRTVSMCRHILIDEVQDVVGVRAEMVLALLRRAGCGFTLLGDLAQSIYGFQADGMTPNEMLTQVRSLFADVVSAPPFSTSFRAQAQHPQEVLAFGARLLDPSEAPRSVADDLRTFELSLPAFGPLDAMKRLMQRGCPTIAILSRKNGTALLVSDQLHRLGVEHQLQPRAEHRPAASWVALSFGAVDGPTVTLTRAAELLRRGAEGEDADELVRRLARLTQSRSDIDLRRIAAMIRSGATPEDLDPDRGSPVVVSTVHRAKGLEFDRVAVVDDFQIDDADPAEESRVRYVALTRAREDIYLLERPRPSVGHLTLRSGRWCIERYGSRGRYVTHIELEGADASSERLEGLAGDAEVARTIQSYIAESVVRGDRLTLERIRGDSSRFWIFHGAVKVGRTGERFEQAIDLVLGKRARRVMKIEGVRVEMVDTVAGDPTLSRQAGLGSNGLWMRVRPSGLGEMILEERTRD